MNVICCHQRDVKFAAHLQKLRVYLPLLRITMILQLQIEVPFSEACLIFPGRLPCPFQISLYNAALHLPGQTGR